MPTGYTADIKDGIDFKTYAMNCARAFGACVMLRDEPGGGERIPDAFEPSDYHLKAVEKARVELAALDAMTPAECERAAAKAWDDAETSRLMRLEDCRKLRAAYEAMLSKVQAWVPPTPDHAGLHEFMRTQIEQSIDFDCNENYLSTPTALLTGEAWAAAERARYMHDVQYHEKEHAGEVDRAASRTAWVRALRAAL
jgi:GTP1/Obg family GTP-binding protein